MRIYKAFRKYQYFFEKSNLLFFITAVSRFTIVTLIIWSSGRPSQGSEPQLDALKVNNKTQAFECIDVQRSSNNKLQVTLKNSYDKPVTAFEVSFGRGRITEEFIYNPKWFIDAGESITNVYGFHPEVLNKGITILAVVFADGSADGDPQIIREITERRLGESIQHARFLDLLKQTLSSSDAELQIAMDDLISKVFSLSDDEQDGFTAHVRYGLRNGKQDILEEIERIQINGKPVMYIREKLIEIMKRFEEKRSRSNVSSR